MEKLKYIQDTENWSDLKPMTITTLAMDFRAAGYTDKPDSNRYMQFFYDHGVPFRQYPEAKKLTERVRTQESKRTRPGQEIPYISRRLPND